MNSHPVKKNCRELFPSVTNSEHWHQSLKPGKHRNTLSQMEFMRRKIKREREGFAPCARQITKECKAMLRNKIEQINLFNSIPLCYQTNSGNIPVFYCTQKGHVAKSCPTKLSDERLYAQAGAITFRHGDEATRARIRKNKESVKCFKCQESGHFTNACPRDDTETMQKQEMETAATIPSLPEPKVSIKYPEFIHFRTRGIIVGTDKGSWDDFWYISNTSNKHTANLKFFSNLKEEFIVEKLEKQGKFLFTYGIGEALIENGDRTYTIPGVHYAPEITLNILSLGLLRQQRFEISSNEDRCTLAYMFKDKRGKDINLDKMREQHNNYLEDYFDALDRSANIERRIEQPYEKENDDVEIGNFHECVAFLDLIRKGEALSNEWEEYRDKFNRVLTWFFNNFLMRPLPGSLPPIIKGVSIHLFDLYELIESMGGYISVQFKDDFEGLAEVLRLERSDGLEIRRCYLDDLEPLVSNYKAARSSNPTGGYEDEGIRRFEDYRGDGNMDGSMAAKEKGRVEHFGITLGKEEEGKKGEALSNEWEEHRDKFNRVLTWFFNHFLMRPLPGSLPPIIKGVSIHLFDLYELVESMGGYISVQFENDFEGLVEVFGLERSDAFEIQRCYLDYLEPLVSNYKVARSSNPTRGYEDEGIRRFKDYHGDGNIDGSTTAKEKGRVEHFGITLEKEEEGKYDASAHQNMARIKCSNEDKRPTKGASTSGPIKEEDTQSFSSGDFTIIT
uniref:ARID DNA-binding domain-containing protein n=1 Tax=Tanacetum cinerariifolium TaxID=118510 RepID=A0A6L2KWG9_TANCI|nr:ARID DNA-binding domain-containing protein [Tanacetum cinerariifolium]